MTIILVGLNHRTTPVELREKLALSDAALGSAFTSLKSYMQLDTSPLLNEVVILSTCNRLEVYVETDDSIAAITLIEQFLSGIHHLPKDAIKTHLYTHLADDAVQHLMRVACGLDSMILGEAQILGQVMQAFEEAHKAGATGAILSHLFTGAIHAGKRARTETAISRYTMSVSHAAALLLLDKLNQRHDARVLIIGAGDMASLAAQALQHFNVTDLTFINRTPSRAESLAQEYDGKVLAWEQLADGLSWADAVITATSAPQPIIYKLDIESVNQSRQSHPLLLIDIAVPRDISENVRELPNVDFFDIDDLQSVVDTNRELRKAAVPEVETIMGQEFTHFTEWYRARQVTPVIKNLREWAEGIADEELGQTLNRLSDADERTRQIVSRMAHRLVNRLLHEPTSRLQIQANEGNGYGYAQAVRELFALDKLDAVECQQDTNRCAFIGQGSPMTRQCDLQCILPHHTGSTS